MLVPAGAQVEGAVRIASEARQRLAGKMTVLYVLPDYFTNRPKPCMNGWGRRYLTVNPSGFVLPCPSAWEIPGLRFDTVREKPVHWIWQTSESFNRFRGTDWMPEPCRSLPAKRNRLWRLPLPSRAADRRSFQYRSCVRAVATPSSRPGSRRSGGGSPRDRQLHFSTESLAAGLIQRRLPALKTAKWSAIARQYVVLRIAAESLKSEDDR